MSASEIRNVTFLGSSDSGKTTLVEAMAHHFGVIDRQGTVDEGSTLTDFTPEEKEKKHSLQAGVVHVKSKAGTANMIDTPGYPDFIADACTSMGAVGVAVLVIGARMEGVPFHAVRLWRMAERAGLARAVVVTKLDGDNLEFDGVLSNLRSAFGDRVIPVTKPNGTGSGFTAVESHDDPEMVDAVVEADDELMEKYLDSGEVSPEEVSRVVPAAMAQGTFQPLFCVNPVDGTGLAEFADYYMNVFPSAGQMHGILDDDAVEGGTESERVVARAWKVMSDKHLGQITYLRLLQGTIKADMALHNPRAEKGIKANGLSHIHGKDTKAIEEARPGDIIALSRVEDLHVGDTIVSEGEAEPHDFGLPEPFTSLSVRPASRADEQKIGQELNKLAKEDPTFRVRRDSITHETIADGLSDLHLQTNLKRMEARGVGFETSLPRIAYQETILQPAEGHHRHKKQTGGRGQFAECYLRLLPNDRGAGFEFLDKVTGGSIPRNFIPAVEKGIVETMVEGIIANSTVVDIKVELYDGKFHDVDSDELSFKLAGGRALRDAFAKAKPILLEPVMEAEIIVPNRFFGDVTGDLNTRRGRVLGMEAEGDFQTIKANVPLAELQSYGTQLRSMTAGEGLFTMKFDHYDQVPSHLQDKVVAECSKELQEA